MNNVGFNYNQALLAGAAPQPMPYSPSYSVPIQSGPAPQPVGPMKTDSYESTRDKDVGDVIGGFFTGAGKAVYDMGHGLFFLGKTAGYAIEHPILSMKKIGGAAVSAVTNPINTAKTVVNLPFAIAKGVVKPYSQAMQQGKYGEALGRFAVDFTVIAASLGQKGSAPADPIPDTPLDNVVDDIGGVVDDIPITPQPTTGGAAGGISNNLSGDVKDVILDSIGSVGNVTGNGNTINVNIGNIQVGGANISGSTMAAGGGGLSGTAGAVNNAEKVGSILDDAAKVVDKVDDAAKVVTKTAESAQAVGAGVNVASASGSTVGTRIGQGIDFVIGAPGKAFNSVGRGIENIGRGIQNVGNAILHPIDTLKGINPVAATEWVANGIRSGGNLVADGLIFAAHNPQQAMIVAGAVGRGGKAAEDILMELDLVR